MHGLDAIPFILDGLGEFPIQRLGATSCTRRPIPGLRHSKGAYRRSRRLGIFFGANRLGKNGGAAWHSPFAIPPT